MVNLTQTVAGCYWRTQRLPLHVQLLDLLRISFQFLLHVMDTSALQGQAYC